MEQFDTASAVTSGGYIALYLTCSGCNQNHEVVVATDSYQRFINEPSTQAHELFPHHSFGEQSLLQAGWCGTCRINNVTAHNSLL